MTVLLQFYLLTSCLIISTILCNTKIRGSSKIKISGIDTHNDDLVQDMMQQFSFGIDSLSSSSKQPETPSKSTNKHKSEHHRREKRFIWITKEKRIVLPPGTQLVFTPTLGNISYLSECNLIAEFQSTL